MTAKEYLNQAYLIDKRINSKIDQIQMLHDLALKTNSIPRDMPGSPNRRIDKLDSIMAKIVDLEVEIDNQIDRLVDLKAEIMRAINKVDDIECKVLLEKRYLLFNTWEDIAAEMDYSVRNIHMIHKRALKIFVVP